MALVPTQNKARVSVAVGNVDLGSFRTQEGGQVAGESLKTRPGGGEEEIVLSSTRSYDNVTVTKLYDGTMKAKRLWLAGKVNKADMVVSVQPLDADDNPSGDPPDVYRGKLIRFTTPQRDSNANEEALCELEMAVESWA